jgi:RHS repeat-associated protein
VSSYTYSADGTLLIQRDAASNQDTLHLPWGEEVYLNTGNGTLSGNRYITAAPDGISIVHASSGAITYGLADTQHTATTDVAASNLAVTNRYYDPYGNPRGTTPSTWADPHAYLGEPQDSTTGLDLLGARQYDPTTGRFLSVDPVLESGDQRQMNGYSYGADDPVNETDPTGAMPSPGGPSCSSPQDCQTQKIRVAEVSIMLGIWHFLRTRSAGAVEAARAQ